MLIKPAPGPGGSVFTEVFQLSVPGLTRKYWTCQKKRARAKRFRLICSIICDEEAK
jgi:hypothetical protein